MGGHLERSDLLEPGRRQVEKQPPGAVSEDADVPLPELGGAVADVPGELLDRRLADVPDNKVALHLDHREAGLDVDPPPASHGGLERHVSKVVLG